jgi:hypothetical protein
MSAPRGVVAHCRFLTPDAMPKIPSAERVPHTIESAALHLEAVGQWSAAAGELDRDNGSARHIGFDENTCGRHSARFSIREESGSCDE